MGFNIEDDGSRHYRIDSDSEIVSPFDGSDYRIDKIDVNMRLGFMHKIRAKYFYPVDTPDDPIKALTLNGFSTPLDATDENAREMAKMGIASGVYDIRKHINWKDLKFPLDSAITGGRKMLDIMQDTTGESETALIGHSTGGITAAHIAIADGRVDYYLGQGIVGIENEKMAEVYFRRRKKVIQGIVMPLINNLVMRKDRIRVGYEYAMRSAYNPTLLARQAIMLCNGPEIAPYFTALEAIGIPRALMIYENDEFFASQKQLDIIDDNPLYGKVTVVPDAGHMHPTLSPVDDARLRVQSIYGLRDIKRSRNTQ